MLDHELRAYKLLQAIIRNAHLALDEAGVPRRYKDHAIRLDIRIRILAGRNGAEDNSELQSSQMQEG